MKTLTTMRVLATLVVSLLLVASPVAHAKIDGVVGTNFNLTASAAYISVADGGSIYSWGYSTDGSMQLPGPTLIVTQGDTVTVTLTNNLPVAAGNVSIVFLGQEVTASGGESGALTREAPNGGTVTYTFTPQSPGTYQYHSGTQSDLQVEMGLFGAMIVRPAAVVSCPATLYPADAMEPGAAYNHPGSCYDREYLFLTSEIDLQVHESVEQQAAGPGPIVLPEGAFYATEYWLLNGRVGPDTMAAAGTGALPHQPYGSLVHMHPGEKILMRVIGGGHEFHPFHHHGNHARVIARDGNMLVNGLGNLAGPTLFTIPSIPGSTTDAIFHWTGKDLGWDMYGHTSAVDPTCIDTTGDGYNDSGTAPTHEYCADHGKPIPVTLPSFNSLAFGGFYSGSPFLGDTSASLPPGEGGLNPGLGFAFMWHSHTERELVNNDVFPGGMMTMLIVEAPFTPIVE
jgi:FtsP/CotA-like multicopper oxidase with cupredoxin domain